jgi:hypothetical protein
LFVLFWGRQKSRTPNGTRQQKRESPRLALRRPTPYCADLACTAGIVQGGRNPWIAGDNGQSRRFSCRWLKPDAAGVTLLQSGAVRFAPDLRWSNSGWACRQLPP